jgi:alanyl-tRNA synthetase
LQEQREPRWYHETKFLVLSELAEDFYFNQGGRMNSKDLRERYIQFFEQRGHRRVPSASLLPENDPTVLFTTAGMHPLVPFLLGEPHPQGKRLVNFQKCIRTNDIDEVGDPSHLTFFEMLGNWSLGDYFKEESLSWSFEFLTSELGIDPARLAVTVFMGDQDAPRDDVSARIWQKLGIPAEHIFFLPKSDNWWGPAGATGPCGPDSEIFYDTGRPDHPGCQPGCKCGKWLEIWNNVFMEYEKNADGSYSKLRQSNVDTGMGVERTVVALQGKDDIFHIDTLFPLVEAIERLSGKRYADNPVPFRVITDHIRAASFAIGDGALPSNVEAGYVVRRMVRRAVRYARDLGIQENFCAALSGDVIDLFCNVYPGLQDKRNFIAEALDTEERKFKDTLERALKQVDKVIERVRGAGETCISGKEAFDLFETYGFPLPLTVEIAQEQGLSVDEAGFENEYRQHRELSRQAHEGNFKGGLADHAVETTRLHTASHLLQAALRQVLGPTIHQMGSNITVERLRFDFSHNTRLNEEQLAEVERIVNEQIARDLPVTMEVLTLEQALQSGALAFFGDKYGQQVKVYTMGDFSKEVCGGPHVPHTGELGKFRITKQEAVGQGIRRIRAVLEER